MESRPLEWQPLDAAVVGGGIGKARASSFFFQAIDGLFQEDWRPPYRSDGQAKPSRSTNEADYAGEAGSPISCGANGTQWLESWKVDICVGRPIVMEKLIRHNLEIGEVQDVYDLSDYALRWKYPYYNFYRVDMHSMLMQGATGPGDGQPAVLKLNHVCESVDHDTGTVGFQNATSAGHDLVIGADGVGSAVRRSLGVNPDRESATSTSSHRVIPTAEVRRLGLPDLSLNNALEYCGGHGPNKICQISRGDGRGRPLVPVLRSVLNQARDIKPWHLYVHRPYPRWHRGRTGILGDAAHPMLPDQSQGACQAIEDAAALGIIFGPRYAFTTDVATGLGLNEQIRKPRASCVQEASVRAGENLSERIGFSSQKSSNLYKVAHKGEKLTIEQVNEYDMHRHIATEAPIRYRSQQWLGPETHALGSNGAERLSQL